MGCGLRESARVSAELPSLLTLNLLLLCSFSLFSSTRYSSRSLLPNDPPPFTVVEPQPSLINGKPVKAQESSQPNVSLTEFPLPDGNWCWASKEWMIDMRNENISYDGFEYNWFFRRHNWRRKAGRLNAGGWVRRRRWVRLMERPPLIALEKEDESEKLVHSATIVTTDVWLGDADDWSRVSRVMRECGRDARRMEVWKEWLGLGEGDVIDEEKHVNLDRGRPEIALISAVVKNHVCGVLPKCQYLY